MNFPLQNGGVQFQTTQEFVSKLKVKAKTSSSRNFYRKFSFVFAFQPLSNLEKDIAAILQSSQNNIEPDSLLTQAEKKIISKMDLLEVRRSNFLRVFTSKFRLGERKIKRIEENASTCFVSTGEIQTCAKNQKQKVKIFRKSTNEFRTFSFFSDFDDSCGKIDKNKKKNNWKNSPLKIRTNFSNVWINLNVDESKNVRLCDTKTRQNGQKKNVCWRNSIRK